MRQLSDRTLEWVHGGTQAAAAESDPWVPDHPGNEEAQQERSEESEPEVPN